MSTNPTEQTATRETTIEADPNLPTIRIIRDFDAPPDRVFKAWVDPELIVQWLGPKSSEIRIDKWDARTGGSYRYASVQDGEEVAAFYGSFHEVRPDERLVQT
ncbi:MAG: SRPBCC domain-containing protein, partial [Propionibacteriaceae bacterium]